MEWLHDRLGDRRSSDETQRRFESLRSHNLLPRGRENSDARLTNWQISSALLSFGDERPGYGGHAALILGDLRPVGGQDASFQKAPTLLEAVSKFFDGSDDAKTLVRLTLSVERNFEDDKYVAKLLVREGVTTRTIPFVSKYAHSLIQPDAAGTYDYERLDALISRERAFGANFFRCLARAVTLSRHLDRPYKWDRQEYETEEASKAFHTGLGARPSSCFMNLRVDAQVAWPKEPTRIKFGGHHLVLFPKTEDQSHSVSIDLAHEKISADEARSLINRMLSVMSWCENQPSSLHEGWSGNPIPVPVPRLNKAFSTMMTWTFERNDPRNEELRRCLAYYRDGLNAASVGLVSHAVLSFYRVFEVKYNESSEAKPWIAKTYPKVRSQLSDEALKVFEQEAQSDGSTIENYIWKRCRVATAHAAKKTPSDPDGTRRSAAPSECGRGPSTAR